MMDRRPDAALHEIEQAREHDEEAHDAPPDAFALIEMRLRGPHQEGRDILGVLLHRLRRFVVIGHGAVGQGRRSCRAAAGHVDVVILPVGERHVRGRVLIALQQRGDVVDARLLVDEPRQSRRAGRSESRANSRAPWRAPTYPADSRRPAPRAPPAHWRRAAESGRWGALGARTCRRPCWDRP